MRLAAVIIHSGDIVSTSGFARDTVDCNPGLALFLINNGPDSDALVRDAVPSQVTVVGPPINRGYAVAANLGIEVAIDQEFDDVVILPDDGLVPAGALSALHREALLNDATVAGPLVLYQNSNVVWANGLTFNRKWGVARNTDKGRKWSGGPSTIDVEYVTGHAILLRGVTARPWLRFDEDLFIYYEDISLCDEVLEREERIVLVQDAVVYHDKPGLTSYRFGRIQERHLARSGFIYWAKHTKGLHRVPHLLGFLTITAYRLLRSASLKALRGGFSGVLDGAVDAVRVLIGLHPRPARV